MVSIVALPAKMHSQRGGLGDFKKRASCWNKRLRGTSCRQVTVLVSYLHVNLTASMSSAPSTIAPQRRAGLRAIRSSTWRRDCRTRRSITASRRLAVPFIRPGRNSTRTSVQQKKRRGGEDWFDRRADGGAKLDWTRALLVSGPFKHGYTNLSFPRRLFHFRKNDSKGATAKCRRRCVNKVSN